MTASTHAEVATRLDSNKARQFFLASLSCLVSLQNGLQDLAEAVKTEIAGLNLRPNRPSSLEIT